MIVMKMRFMLFAVQLFRVNQRLAIDNDLIAVYFVEEAVAATRMAGSTRLVDFQ